MFSLKTIIVVFGVAPVSICIGLGRTLVKRA